MDVTIPFDYLVLCASAIVSLITSLVVGWFREKHVRRLEMRLNSRLSREAKEQKRQKATDTIKRTIGKMDEGKSLVDATKETIKEDPLAAGDTLAEGLKVLDRIVGGGDDD